MAVHTLLALENVQYNFNNTAVHSVIFLVVSSVGLSARRRNSKNQSINLGLFGENRKFGLSGFNNKLPVL